MKKLLFISIFLTLVLGLYAATNAAQQNYNEDELISIASDISFAKAVNALQVMSEKYEDKKIVNLSAYSGPINIPLNFVYWKQALTILVEHHNLVMQELPGAYKISDPEEPKMEKSDIDIDAKQIRISSIFFKTDVSVSKGLGIDWSAIYSGEVNISSAEFSGGSNIADAILEASTQTTQEVGGYSIDINALLRILESHQKGSVIARPSVTVLSSKSGYIQVGEDFSVKTTDEAGNTTDQFFQTGIILNVTPTVVEDDGQEAIHLEASVEKSSASPGNISTIILKSQSQTEVLLYDGEQTVIGGLYDTDVVKTRSGIPLLKDLPWWFFGIRYLTGYTSTEKKVREMIIVLKAEIIDKVSDRLKNKTTTKDEIKKIRDDHQEVEELFR
jgi:type IV pilus assembly protein PilQ